MGEPKSDRCGSFTSAGWKRQHGGKDMPSNWRSPPRPGAKSPEQGRSYNRLNREVDRRREGDGWVRSVCWAARKLGGLKSPRRSDEERRIRKRGNASLAGKARRYGEV